MTLYNALSGRVNEEQNVSALGQFVIKSWDCFLEGRKWTFSRTNDNFNCKLSSISCLYQCFWSSLKLLLKAPMLVWCWTAPGLSQPHLPNKDDLEVSLQVLVNYHSIKWGFPLFPDLGWNHSCCIVHINSATNYSLCLFQGTAVGAGIWVQTGVPVFHILPIMSGYFERNSSQTEYSISISYLTNPKLELFSLCNVCWKLYVPSAVWYHWAGEKWEARNPAKPCFFFKVM